MTDETLDGVFINPGFFGMCNKCFTAVMRVMRRDTEGLNSLIKVASIEFIAGVAIRTISAGKIEWIFIMVGFSIKVSFLHDAKNPRMNRNDAILACFGFGASNHGSVFKVDI